MATPTNWTAIEAFATIFTAIAAFAAVYVTYRALKSQEAAFRASGDAYRLSLSADLVARLEGKFDSETLLQLRHAAAQTLLDQQNLTNAEDVFDFFEMLGLLNRLGALNDEMVHCMFFHWINLYWVAGRDYILRTRAERTAELWVDFQFVYEKTYALEKRKDPLSQDLELSKEVLTLYLEQEMQA